MNLGSSGRNRLGRALNAGANHLDRCLDRCLDRDAFTGHQELATISGSPV